MKINKKVKIVLFSLLGIFVLFFAILLFHVITAKPVVYELQHVQISRIDFKNDIDSTQAKKICADMRTIPGLTSDSIIVKRNVVVYFHNNTITNSEKVYNQLMTKGKYDAKRFVLPANLENKPVCPVDVNSFSYKWASALNRMFN